MGRLLGEFGMTVKHTPGPWKAWQPRGDESVPVRTDGLGITIAYVHQGAITDAQANARLIAAAPELLEAAIAGVAYMQALMSCANDPLRMTEFGTAQGDDLDTLFEAWENKSRAAIAKAEGRS